MDAVAQHVCSLKGEHGVLFVNLPKEIFFHMLCVVEPSYYYILPILRMVCKRLAASLARNVFPQSILYTTADLAAAYTGDTAALRYIYANFGLKNALGCMTLACQNGHTETFDYLANYLSLFGAVSVEEEEVPSSYQTILTKAALQSGDLRMLSKVIARVGPDFHLVSASTVARFYRDVKRAGDAEKMYAFYRAGLPVSKAASFRKFFWHIARAYPDAAIEGLAGEWRGDTSSGHLHIKWLIKIGTDQRLTGALEDAFYAAAGAVGYQQLPLVLKAIKSRSKEEMERRGVYATLRGQRNILTWPNDITRMIHQIYIKRMLDIEFSMEGILSSTQLTEVVFGIADERALPLYTALCARVGISYERAVETALRRGNVTALGWLQPPVVGGTPATRLALRGHPMHINAKKWFIMMSTSPDVVSVAGFHYCLYRFSIDGNGIYATEWCYDDIGVFDQCISYYGRCATCMKKKASSEEAIPLILENLFETRKQLCSLLAYHMPEIALTRAHELAMTSGLTDRSRAFVILFTDMAFAEGCPSANVNKKAEQALLALGYTRGATKNPAYGQALRRIEPLMNQVFGALDRRIEGCSSMRKALYSSDYK